MAVFRYWLVVSAATHRLLFERTIYLIHALEEFCGSRAWFWFGKLDLEQMTESDLEAWWDREHADENRSSFSVNLPWGEFMQSWTFAVHWGEPSRLEASIDWAQFRHIGPNFAREFADFILARTAADSIEFTDASGEMITVLANG
jgi:hypothetical protein